MGDCLLHWKSMDQPRSETEDRQAKPGAPALFHCTRHLVPVNLYHSIAGSIDFLT